MTSRPFDALLCDIDGTLVFQGRPIEGAAVALAAVRRAGYRVALSTNITAKSSAHLAAELQGYGFAVADLDIISATTACASFLRRVGARRCRLLLPSAAAESLAEFDCGDAPPEYVILGDLAHAFTYDLLNGAFLDLDRGAALIALQRGMFWYDGPEKRLDVGAFVAALEAASGREAILMGKPSHVFFEAALEATGSLPDRTLVIGDDFLSDIRGAVDYGMPAAWVATGKAAPAEAAPANFRLTSIAQLPALLGIM